MKLINYCLLLLLTLACSHQPAPKVPEVVVTDPATLPVEIEKPVDVIVLDQDTLKKEVFSVRSSLPYMAEVARISNCIINNHDFLKEVENYPKFTFTDKTPKQVVESLRNPRPVVLSTYRTKNPWSAAIATTFASDKETVYFNTRKNPRDMPSMVNTSLHEGLHLNGYGHGDNYPNGKEDSVNYRVGSIAEKYVTRCEKK